MEAARASPELSPPERQALKGMAASAAAQIAPHATKARTAFLECLVCIGMHAPDLAFVAIPACKPPK